MDLISRQAAIDAVNEVIADYIPTLYGRYEALPLEMAMAIKHLPTAEPRKGKWIVVDGRVVCSECYNPNTETNYCPNCGAKMEESE